jgi:hypothetical protein
MRVVATASIIGIGVVIAAIMGSQDSSGWLIGLVVSVVSVPPSSGRRGGCRRPDRFRRRHETALTHRPASGIGSRPRRLPLILTTPTLPGSGSVGSRSSPGCCK